jgi:hypothetical protein
MSLANVKLLEAVLTTAKTKEVSRNITAATVSIEGEARRS